MGIKKYISEESNLDDDSIIESIISVYLGQDFFPNSSIFNRDRFIESKKLYNIAITNDDYKLASSLTLHLNIYTFLHNRFVNNRFNDLKEILECNNQYGASYILINNEKIKEASKFKVDNEYKNLPNNSKFIEMVPISFASQYFLDLDIIGRIGKKSEGNDFLGNLSGLLSGKIISLPDSSRIFGEVEINYISKVVYKLSPIFERVESIRNKSIDNILSFIDGYKFEEKTNYDNDINKELLIKEMLALNDLRLYSYSVYNTQIKKIHRIAKIVRLFENLRIRHKLSREDTFFEIKSKYNISQGTIIKYVKAYRHYKQFSEYKDLK